MIQNKFEFTEQDKDKIYADTPIDQISCKHLNALLDRIESIISSRSASAQPATESAEEVLKSITWYGDTPFVDMYEKTTESIIKAMHKFAASQVEAAVKEKDVEIAEKDKTVRWWLNSWNHLNGMYDTAQSKISQLEAALKVQTDKVGELEELVRTREERIMELTQYAHELKSK